MARKEEIIPTEMAPFFQELRMPTGLNGNEEKSYLEYIDRPNRIQVMEVFRRMQDVYNTINAGRFFLCEAQRKSFPEVYKEPTPKWTNDWIRVQFITSSIQFYNSAFDIYLQVNWLYYEIYKEVTDFKVLSSENLDKILSKCKIKWFTDPKKRIKFNPTIYNTIATFEKSDSYQEIHKLCNIIKHRKGICFKELMDGKHQIYIDIDNYNSHDALLVKTIPSVIIALKNYHKDITSLCNTSVPFWTFNIETGEDNT